MITKRCIVVAFVLALFASVLSAEPLIDGEGDDSGWSATLAGTVESITVIDVVLGESMTLEIEKDFVGMDGDQFPVGLIIFSPNGPAVSVPKIIIQSEGIENNTGHDWTSYHWAIMNAGVAHFNTTESSGWTVSPYTNLTWQNAWNLFADEGVVCDGGTFNPNGGLVIDIDAEESFTFKQFPVPEPAVMLILLFGLPAVILRKFKQRA